MRVRRSNRKAGAREAGSSGVDGGAVGNQAVQRLLQSRRSLDGATHPATHPAATIGSEHDAREREAEHVSRDVTAPATPRRVVPPAIQFGSGTPSTALEAPAPPSVGLALSSPGRPLDRALQLDMEQRFAHDFSRVRIHTGPIAERSARAIDADAYAAGNDIVLGASHPSPASSDGRQLIAHELTHVVQSSRDHASATEPARVRRQPHSAKAPTATARKKVIAIHVAPKSTTGATAFVEGETEPIAISVDKNEYQPGRYSLRKTGLREGTVEFVVEGGGDQTRIHFTIPRRFQYADRVVLDVGEAEVTPDTIAKSEFESIPDRIKSRLAERGGSRLQTPDDYIGFAAFAHTLMEHGVTDEELILFQKHRARPGQRRINWARDWMTAVNEVLGARGTLEKNAATNLAEFQDVTRGVPNLTADVLDLYRMRRWSPELQLMAREQLEAAGVDLKALRATGDKMMLPFDARLRMETNAALDRLEGGLLLTQERYVQAPDSTQKIEAMRSAAQAPALLTLKAHKEDLGDARDEADGRLRVAVMDYSPWLTAPAVVEATKAFKTADSAYDAAKHDYLAGLEKTSGVPVSSWRGFDVDEFFYGAAKTRSLAMLRKYVATTLFDLARARRALAEDKRTIYKADMMVQRTKDVLGVKPGSFLNELVDERVEEYQSAPWWEWLLNILSLALVFVPGGAVVLAARVALGVTQTVLTIDEQATYETLSRADVRQEGGSLVPIALSLGGNALDLGELNAASRTSSIANVAEHGGSTLSHTGSSTLEEVETSTTAAKPAGSSEAIEAKPPTVPETTTPPPANAPPHPPASGSPSILDRKPMEPHEAFSSLKDELKAGGEEGTGPMLGQQLGERDVGPLREAAPSRLSQEQREAVAQQEKDLAATHKQEVLDEMKQRAPEVHQDVVNPSNTPLQSGQDVGDWAAHNPDRAELLHAEWKDGIANGRIKKRTTFAQYLRRRIAGDRGIGGELEYMWVNGHDAIVLKAPKPNSNLPGTDMLIYTPSTGRIQYIDNKAIRAGATVGKVSALEKNFLGNMSKDIDDIERYVRWPDVPPEIRDVVLPRMQSARIELQDYIKTNRIRGKRFYSGRVRDAFDSILRNNGIERVVTFGGAGEGARISTPLSGAAGFGTSRP
ncbi:MAG: DUF4157 domain-containing protein [Gemmatimonadaceae bacterium]